MNRANVATSEPAEVVATRTIGSRSLRSLRSLHFKRLIPLSVATVATLYTLFNCSIYIGNRTHDAHIHTRNVRARGYTGFSPLHRYSRYNLKSAASRARRVKGISDHAL